MDVVYIGEDLAMLADEAAFTKWFEQHLERLMLLLLRHAQFAAYLENTTERTP